MRKYVIFISENQSKAIAKEDINRDLINKMKLNGFKKYHVEVEAESEKEAIVKLNKQNDSYLNALGDFSGSILICSVVIVILSLIYLFS